jgi:hypothetical protein
LKDGVFRRVENYTAGFPDRRPGAENGLPIWNAAPNIASCGDQREPAVHAFPRLAMEIKSPAIAGLLVEENAGACVYGWDLLYRR